MSERLKKAVERAALAADELMGFLSSVGHVLAEESDFSDGYWEAISPALQIREEVIHLLDAIAPADAARLIHIPQLPDPDLSASDDPLWERPTEPGRSLGTAEVIPAASNVPGLGSWCDLARVVNQN